jgi:hypothetical protein
MDSPIDKLSGNAAAGDDSETPTPATILKAGTAGAAGASPTAKSSSGPAKVANSPWTQGAAGAAGVGLAPLTGGLSMLIPVAAKLIGSLLGRKPKPQMTPGPVNTDAGLDAMAAKSFGGM